MTEEGKQSVESGQEPQEGQEGMPTPDFSDASGDEQTSGTGVPDAAAFADEVWSEIESRIDERLERGVQSVKDKRFNKLERKIEDFGEVTPILTRFQELTKSGMSEEDAIWRIELDNRINRIEGQQQGGQQRQPGASRQPQGSGNVDVAKRQREILEDFGISASDGALRTFINSKEWKNPDEYINALQMWALGRSASKPEPSAASGGSPSGSGPVKDGAYPDLSDDELAAKYDELSIEASKNMPELKKINDELTRRAAE